MYQSLWRDIDYNELMMRTEYYEKANKCVCISMCFQELQKMMYAFREKMHMKKIYMRNLTMALINIRQVCQEIISKWCDIQRFIASFIATKIRFIQFIEYIRTAVNPSFSPLGGD